MIYSFLLLDAEDCMAIVVMGLTGSYTLFFCRGFKLVSVSFKKKMSLIFIIFIYVSFHMNVLLSTSLSFNDIFSTTLNSLILYFCSQLPFHFNLTIYCNYTIITVLNIFRSDLWWSWYTECWPRIWQSLVLYSLSSSLDSLRNRSMF